MSSGLSSHLLRWWIGSGDDAENEHRFMQDGLQSIKYLDPLGTIPLLGRHDSSEHFGELYVLLRTVALNISQSCIQRERGSTNGIIWYRNLRFQKVRKENESKMAGWNDI